MDQAKFCLPLSVACWGATSASHTATVGWASWVGRCASNRTRNGALSVSHQTRLAAKMQRLSRGCVSGGFSAVCLLLFETWSSEHVGASTIGATSPPPVIVVDPAALGLPFDGIGGVNGGNGARLLANYPQPQRDAVLDLLFSPQVGCALNILKVKGDFPAVLLAPCCSLRVRVRRARCANQQTCDGPTPHSRLACAGRDWCRWLGGQRRRRASYSAHTFRPTGFQRHELFPDARGGQEKPKHHALRAAVVDAWVVFWS
jgi:hypothetical protein